MRKEKKDKKWNSESEGNVIFLGFFYRLYRDNATNSSDFIITNIFSERSCTRSSPVYISSTLIKHFFLEIQLKQK